MPIPKLSKDELAAMRGMNYRDLAFEVIRRFADDIPAADLKAIVDKTYTAEIFRSDDITPVKTLEPGLHILGLSNGPTLAFKDVAMQLLGNLFEYVLDQGKRRDQHSRRDLGRHRQRGGIRHARQAAASRCSCSRRWAR